MRRQAYSASESLRGSFEPTSSTSVSLLAEASSARFGGSFPKLILAQSGQTVATAKTSAGIDAERVAHTAILDLYVRLARPESGRDVFRNISLQILARNTREPERLVGGRSERGKGLLT